tara:strand:- start:46 stop:264 length:219 start_codon:yes stop_codon:yes gene_type:complete
MELSIKILNDEFVKWMHRHGAGRNEEGLRFGQFMHNTYSINIVEGMESNSILDGYYDEAPSEAYNKIFKLVG